MFGGWADGKAILPTGFLAETSYSGSGKLWMFVFEHDRTLESTPDQITTAVSEIEALMGIALLLKERLDSAELQGREEILTLIEIARANVLAAAALVMIDPILTEADRLWRETLVPAIYSELDRLDWQPQDPSVTQADLAAMSTLELAQTLVYLKEQPQEAQDSSDRDNSQSGQSCLP